MDNQNNGMMTGLWGPPIWDGGFFIAFGYSLNPTDEEKQRYMNHFENLGYILPCRFCRESYQEFLKTTNTLSLKNMESRHTLINWLFEMKNTVNKKLGVDYGTTIEDVYERFESARSSCGKVDVKAKGCVSPVYYKQKAYENMYYRDPPIILLSTMDECMNIAKIRNLPNEYFEFHKIVKNYKCDIKVLKKLPIWKKRKIECHNIITDMRINGINSLETEGKFKNFPTIHELKLLSWMSTSLRQDELCDMLKTICNSPINFDLCFVK